MIWSEAYNHLIISNENGPPKTWDEIFSATKIEEPTKRKAAIWLHITCLYEIWCWYAQVKWGQKWIPESILPDIIQMRITRKGSRVDIGGYIWNGNHEELNANSSGYLSSRLGGCFITFCSQQPADRVQVAEDGWDNEERFANESYKNEPVADLILLELLSV
ncbi:hypothetical protein C2G38_2185597 [Gigaspora rosea]|uniref:Uncharacterized protein n=1 Tax=Gigaspora rosea TaxID=44941 RepID=A0A397VFG0_9GLOM|nr:hypothetical protein C2G38_2185597 [Gigaspora rosea]